MASLCARCLVLNSPKAKCFGSGTVGLAIFAACFTLFSLSSSPTIGWLDSPEFVAQAASLGVAHSPGHPLPALLGRLATLFPIGDIVWRVNLMSSLCAALAIASFFYCIRLFLSISAPALHKNWRTILAATIAMLLACSWAVWANATRAEVYALQALLLALSLYFILRYVVEDHPRDLFGASFSAALGLANHHVMMLMLFVPGLVFLFARSRRPSLAQIKYSLFIGLTGLSALLYLPLRSLAHPLVNFGAPHTLERFIWTLRGAAFSKSVAGAHVSSPFLDSLQILSALSASLSLPLLLLAFIGIFTGVQKPKLRPLSLFLCSVLALCITLRVLLGFDPSTADHHAYLLPALMVLFLFTALGIAQLCQWATHAVRPLPTAPALALFAIALIIPIQLWSNWQKSNLASSWGADEVARWELRTLPPRSLVLTAYFQTTFRQWALQVVDGARPDISLLDRSFLGYPGMPEEAMHADPSLTDLIRAPLRPGVPSPMALLQATAKARPVFVQLHPSVDLALQRAVLPAGPFARFVGSGLGVDDALIADRLARRQLQAIVKRGSPAEQHEAVGTLLWHDATRLDQYCTLGQRENAAEVYRQALTIAPRDEMLHEMALRCQLLTP